MFEIKRRKQMNQETFELDILAPRVAASALPGQFVIVKEGPYGERIPLTISDYDPERGRVSVVIQTVGAATKKLSHLQEGAFLTDFVGPLGNPSELVGETAEALKSRRILFVAGGLGAAPIYPQVKYLHAQGVPCEVMVGARSKELLILEKELGCLCETLHICTDDGSRGFHGNVAAMLKELVQFRGKHYDRVIAIGPMIMMKFVCLATKALGIPTTVSMNPIMVDGTGMCGACRVTVGDQVKFACVDGPEFDGHLVDFDEAMKRQRLYQTQEGREVLARITPEPTHASHCSFPHDLLGFNQWRRVPVPAQDPKIRAKNFEEVSFGYSPELALQEAGRCLHCKTPKCVQACPVSIDIPGFIAAIQEGDPGKAAKIIGEASSLPAVCGRVCPQEDQCEGACIRGIKGDPVAIGALERFVGDYAIAHPGKGEGKRPTGRKVAVIGAGPAGLACAGDLAKKGYRVHVFEALHELGGVLVYGIPEFRLPKEKVVAKEIESLKRLGVVFETNVVVGRTVTLESLMGKEGFEAVFIGSGAGLPKFMGIAGENANGVFSANEYLTRSNLMKAYTVEYDTPITRGKRVAVVGGGNVAMDAARTALRLGAEVHVVYRRSMAELPARKEEVHHAQEEGILFDVLTSPLEILTDEEGWVKGMRCIRMALGAPDASGRKRPVAVPGSEFEMPVDTVLMALGTSPNPLIASTTPGLALNRRNCVVVDEESGATTKPGVFAGGDAVTGAATVILAMGAGRKAAAGIHAYLEGKA